MPTTLNVLVAGATGSIGKLVVAEAIRQGHTVRALVRSRARAFELPPDVQLLVGDLTKPDTLHDVAANIDAIVFTHGSDGEGKKGAESIDYGGVRNLLRASGPKRPRIALMTAIGVTDREGAYNRSTEAHDWKRRAERLVRAGGFPFTIVRPGWFDYNRSDDQQLVFLQGDTRHAGNSSDGVISRRQIARVLVNSLTSDYALRKTFELVAAAGPPQENLDPLFAALKPDPQGALDGVLDMQNQPLEDEPQRVREDLRCLSGAE
jgi:uncharacterized protein YbjT (DUF2867 family)